MCACCAQDKSFYRIPPHYTHQGGLSHGGGSNSGGGLGGGGGGGGGGMHAGSTGPSIIPGINLQPLPGLPSMAGLYGGGMGNPQNNYYGGYNNNSNNN